MPNVWEIENTNKLIFEIDKNYKELLLSLCSAYLKQFSGVPLEAQDIYNEFLSSIKVYCKAYNPRKKVPFKTYISLQCKYFVMNTCKKYLSTSHSIMNNYVEWDDSYGFVSDSVIETNDISLEDLTEAELRYFKYHFLVGLKGEDLHKKLKLSRYKCVQLHEQIMNKMKAKLKI